MCGRQLGECQELISASFLGACREDGKRVAGVWKGGSFQVISRL